MLKFLLCGWRTLFGPLTKASTIAGDMAGGQLTKQGEDYRQAEVTAKVPPDASVMVVDDQGVNRFWEVWVRAHDADIHLDTQRRGFDLL